MIWLLVALALADPGGPCQDRSPGLSKCIEYKEEGTKGWSCKAACYTRQGKTSDGGTDAGLVYSSEPPKPTRDACKADLERQAKKGCRP